MQPKLYINLAWICVDFFGCGPVGRTTSYFDHPVVRLKAVEMHDLSVVFVPTLHFDLMLSRCYSLVGYNWLGKQHFPRTQIVSYCIVRELETQLWNNRSVIDKDLGLSCFMTKTRAGSESFFGAFLLYFYIWITSLSFIHNLYTFHICHRLAQGLKGTRSLEDQITELSNEGTSEPQMPHLKIYTLYTDDTKLNS